MNDGETQMHLESVKVASIIYELAGKQITRHVPCLPAVLADNGSTLNII